MIHPHVIPQVLTLSVVSLTKSALRAIDCTYDAAQAMASITADRCSDYSAEIDCDYINCAWDSGANGACLEVGADVARV